MSTKPVRSKTVVLKLPPASLRAFPHEPAAAPVDTKSISSPDPTPTPQVVEPTVDTPADADADADADSASAMNGTSTPSSLAPPAAGQKRKAPAPKRKSLATAEAANGQVKQRGKPGPKKKLKMGDMINDPNSKGAFAAPTPAQKLGPKANAGAINANLRSLDRSGKFKARKWVKKGLALRSFTGVVWTVPTYTAPPRSSAFSEDVKSDSTGSSDSKVKDESSAVSEKSGLNGTGGTPAPTTHDNMASSPTPIAAA